MQDRNDKTALELNQNLARAARQGDVARMAELLRNGANPDARVTDSSWPSLLFEAAEKDHAEMARLLLDHGANPDRRDLSNMTPLLLAVKRGHLETARLLLDRGAQMGQKSLEGGALALAERLEDNGPMLRLLLGRLSPKNLSSAFFEAAKRGETETVRACLRLPGFDVNQQDSLGNTGLILAAASAAPGSESVIGLLLRRGAAVDAENHLQETALSAALTGDKAQVASVRLLVEAGADIWRTNLAGVSNFEAAQLSGDKDLLPCFETARRLRMLRDLKKTEEGGTRSGLTRRIVLKPRKP